jgi:two-component system, cell cycle response regulator DivK
MTDTRVLVADPDPEARMLCREVFRRAGCEVLEASDGREALVAALVRNPSLIVVDIRLPLVSGPSLCQILRRDTVTRAVPILALVDGNSSIDADSIRQAGADVVFSKPVNPHELLNESRRLAIAGPLPAPQISDARTVPSRSPDSGNGRRRVAISKIHSRFTTTNPPSPPPTLRCPLCDASLVYECSHIGGVSTRYPERWDDYACATCGAFEYRHRTRKLRPRQGPA